MTDTQLKSAQNGWIYPFTKNLNRSIHLGTLPVSFIIRLNTVHYPFSKTKWPLNGTKMGSFCMYMYLYVSVCTCSISLCHCITPEDIVSILVFKSQFQTGLIFSHPQVDLLNSVMAFEF